MTETIHTITVGQAKITVVNFGNITLPLVEYMNVPAEAIDENEDLQRFAAQTTVPMHSIIVQLPHTTALIDAGVYDLEPDSEYLIPNYQPPLSLTERIAELGISLEDIEHVVITHRHWDHFNATTVKQDGEYVPRFPQARYYLGQQDWERAAQALQDPASIEYRTLRILNQRGALELVDGDQEIVTGIIIFAAPGETRGHQVVRVQSDGETFYGLGDLFHHPIELQNPEWMVSWARPETTAASRAKIIPAALEERALLAAGHIWEIGRLQKTGTGVRWEAVN